MMGSEVLSLKSPLIAIHANGTSNNAFLYADFIYSDISMLKEEKKVFVLKMKAY